MKPITAPLSLIQKVQEFADPLPLGIQTRLIAASLKKGTLNRKAIPPFIMNPTMYGSNKPTKLAALVLFESNVA